jgi:pyrroline-5-carboxylate reductase
LKGLEKISTMINRKIAFIGGGNMANAIIGGLLSSGLNSGDIVVSDPSELARNHLQSIFKVRTTADNSSTVDGPGYVLVLAVKPQMMKVVAQGISKMVEQFQPLIISIAAGITIPSLINWLTVGIDSVPHIIRIMPNTPSLVNEGAAGLYAAANVNEEERGLASELTKSVAKS